MSEELKKRLDAESVKVIYGTHPFLAMLHKDEDAAEAMLVLPLIPPRLSKLCLKFIAEWDRDYEDVPLGAKATESDAIEQMLKALGVQAARLSKVLFLGGDNFLGLAQWIPDLAPHRCQMCKRGQPFAGVDRSVDPIILSGVRYNGTAQSIHEALIDTAALVAREGRCPNVAFVGPGRLKQLRHELHPKVSGVLWVSDIYPAIQFHGIQLYYDRPNNLSINVFEDSDCPTEQGYVLDDDTWILCSMKRSPHPLVFVDDEILVVDETSGNPFGRACYYAQLMCNAPYGNGTVRLKA